MDAARLVLRVLPTRFRALRLVVYYALRCLLYEEVKLNKFYRHFRKRKPATNVIQSSFSAIITFHWCVENFTNTYQTQILHGFSCLFREKNKVPHYNHLATHSALAANRGNNERRQEHDNNHDDGNVSETINNVPQCNARERKNNDTWGEKGSSVRRRKRQIQS